MRDSSDVITRSTPSHVDTRYCSPKTSDGAITVRKRKHEETTLDMVSRKRKHEEGKVGIVLRKRRHEPRR